MKKIIEQYSKVLREIDILRQMIKEPQPTNELKRDIEVLGNGEVVELTKTLIMTHYNRIVK
jgi:hypothetical protein